MTIDPKSFIDPFHGLRTKRLVLRKLTMADSEAFAEYRADSSVARYQSWSDYTLDEAKALIANQQPLEFGEPGSWCQIALIHRDTGRLVGDCAYHTPDDDPRQAELGCTIATEFQGQGFAREAATALIDYAMRERGLHRIHAIVDVENSPAWGLLTRLGFRREAHYVDNIWFKGKWGSEYRYALLKREWADSDG